MFEKSSNLLLSLMASGLISGSKIPSVDVSIANVMETYIIRCLRNSSLEDILDLFSIENKDEFILLNNHGVPFPFARFTEDEEVFISEMEKKANRPLIRPSSPLVLGELYVVNKAGELILVKSFRLRNYMVNNHFLKNGNLIIDLYLNKQQTLAVMEKGALVAPISEYMNLTLFQKYGKIFKESVDKEILTTELSDKEKYVIVGRRTADISLSVESDSDNIYAVVQGIPLFEAKKRIEEKWIEVDSITCKWFEQECLFIQFSEPAFRPLQIELDEQILQYKNETLEDSIKVLIKSRWIVFNLERKSIKMEFSFSRFQESINILKKKIHEILLLPRHTLENRKLVRGIISSIESTTALINRILWAIDLLKLRENIIVPNLLNEEKESLSKLLAIVHNRYLYYFCLIRIDEKVYVIPSSDLILIPDGDSSYQFNVCSSDLRGNDFVNLNVTFKINDEVQFLRMFIEQRIAYIEFREGVLTCFESWQNVRKRTKQLENMPMEIRGYLIGHQLCKEHGINDYPKLDSFLTKNKISLYLRNFLLNQRRGFAGEPKFINESFGG